MKTTKTMRNTKMETLKATYNFLNAVPFERSVDAKELGFDNIANYIKDYKTTKLVERTKKLLDKNNISYSDSTLNTIQDILMNNKKKRNGEARTFSLLKFSVTDGVFEDKTNRVIVDLKECQVVDIQESNMTMQLSKDDMISNVLIFDMKLPKGKDDSEELNQKLETIINDGVWIEGKRFGCFLRTTSQSRSCRLYFTDYKLVRKYRTALGNGVDFDGMLNSPVKLEARISLSCTNGTPMVEYDNNNNVSHYYRYSVKHVDDLERTMSKSQKLIIPDDKKDSVTGHWDVLGKKEVSINSLTKEYESGLITEEEYHKTLKLFNVEVNDGYGFVSVQAASHWAYKLGLINKRELEYFLLNFVSIKKIRRTMDKVLKAIFDKIPTAFQIRHHFDKGLVILWDLKAEGIEEDVVITKGMHKMSEEPVSSDAWLIANYNKAKGRYNKLSYQAIQALQLSDELLHDLAVETMDKYRDCFSSAEKAIETLSIHDQEEELDSNSSQVIELLKANPECITWRAVQDKLFDLLAKQIYQVAIGRVVCESAYYYMISDPFALMNSILGEDKYEEMDSKEYYLNNRDEEVALVRYPCASFLEPQKVQLVKDKYNKQLWYLKDILVFNVKDFRWLAMGGADFDGDFCLVIFDERIVNELETFNSILTIVTHKELDDEVCDQNTRNRMYYAGKDGNDVGLISNMLAKYNSKVEHDGLVNEPGFLTGEYYTNVCRFCFYVGKEIDRPKTNEQVEMDAKLQDYVSKFKPDWIEAVKEIKSMDNAKNYNNNFMKELAQNKKVVASNCQMGRFFRRVAKEYHLFNGDNRAWKEMFIQADDKSFLSLIKPTISMRNIDKTKEVVDRMMKAYREHLLVLKDMEYDSEEERNEAYSNIFKIHRELFDVTIASNGMDYFTASYLACKIPYERDLKNKNTVVTDANGKAQRMYASSRSYAMNICGDYIYRMLLTADKGVLYVKIPDTTLQRVVVSRGYLFMDGLAYRTKVADGEYDVVRNSKGCFILVEEGIDTNLRLGKEKLDENTSKDSRDGFELNNRVAFTIFNTKAFNTTPKAVLEQIAGKEVVVVEDAKNKGSFILSDESCEGICSVLLDDETLASNRFFVPEDILSNVNLYNSRKGNGRVYENGKAVRERVSIVVEHIEELNDIEKEIYNVLETPKYEMDIDITEDDRVNIGSISDIEDDGFVVSVDNEIDDCDFPDFDFPIYDNDDMDLDFPEFEDDVIL